MKIQCPCGAKYSVDITPEMVAQPVQFVCQTCGLDSSAAVNELIRREMASMTAPVAASANEAPRLRTARASEPVATMVPVSPAATEPAARPQVCAKHPNQPATHQCLVCNKPMCLKCQELFGYVCSPFCQSKAEAQRMNIPEYAGRKTAVEAREWRKLGLISGAIAAVVAAGLGLWFWYAWFASVPGPVFSVRFEQAAFSGQTQLCGKNQIVFLRDDTLFRYDLKTKKEIWSRPASDKKRIDEVVGTRLKAMEALMARANKEGWEHMPKSESREELTLNIIRSLASSLQLHVCGSNVWVVDADKVVRYDWATGEPQPDISLPAGSGAPLRQGDELVLTAENDRGQEVVTHINLATAQSRVEEVGEPVQPAVADAGKAAGARNRKAGEVPVGGSGANGKKPLDPAQVAEQVQHLPYAAKIALPAVLAVNQNQQRALAEMEDEPRLRGPAVAESDTGDSSLFIPSQYGYVQFSARLLEKKLVARKAMKDRPAKSVLEDNLTVTRTAEVANEMLNDAQRERGADTVVEDQSRYQVTVHSPDQKIADWSGEVVGPPELFSLKTVNVVAAGNTLIVLDKSNKKLWQTTLTYRIAHGIGNRDEASATTRGQGPCVERGDRLYVFDEAVLAAFNLATGQAQWRLPSIGVTGVFFDERGMLYVNTTTASPDNIKYSRQIDITQKTRTVVLKVDPATGKTLWSVKPGGPIAYLSGKFIYVMESYAAPEMEADSPYRLGVEIPSHVAIRRLDPGDGHMLWEHYQKRAPLDVQFSNNSIQLVFRKEVQVLRFLSL